MSDNSNYDNQQYGFQNQANFNPDNVNPNNVYVNNVNANNINPNNVNSNDNANNSGYSFNSEGFSNYSQQNQRNQQFNQNSNIYNQFTSMEERQNLFFNPQNNENANITPDNIVEEEDDDDDAATTVLTSPGFSQFSSGSNSPQNAANGMPLNFMPENGPAMDSNTVKKPKKAKTPKPPKAKKAAKQKNNTKSKKNLLIGILIAAVLVLIGLAIVYFVLIRPKQQLKKALSSAKAYEEDNNYQEALNCYKDALDIDSECVPAMVGSINAYDKLEKPDALVKFYDEQQKTIEGLDKETKKENIDDIVIYYTDASLVYPDDYDKQIDILNDGYQFTDNNEDIKTALVASYIGKATVLNSNEEYENELTLFETIHSLTTDDVDAEYEYASCLNNYITSLIDAGQLDDAQAVIEKYDGTSNSVDFERYKTELDDMRAEIAEKEAFMKNAYDYMSAGKYDSMITLFTNKDSQATAAKFNDTYIYAPEGGGLDFTGTGVGIYLFSNGTYYFYYGEYASGQRSGAGKSFYHYNTSEAGSYSIFNGKWSSDKPNGEGTLGHINYKMDNKNYQQYFKGEFVDGIENGDFTSSFIWDGITFTGKYSTASGVPVDIRDKYSNYDYNVADDQAVYVVYTKSGNERYIYSHAAKNSLLAVPGF